MHFFIDVETRQVFFADVTANPTGVWTTQAARNLFLRHGDHLAGTGALLRDRGSQFIDFFDEIFRTEGFKILRPPSGPRSPTTSRNGGSARSDESSSSNPQGCPVPIIWNTRQLERLADYIAHYNLHRPHQSLDQRPPTPAHLPPETAPATTTMLRTSRCDGLIHEYRTAA